MAKKEEGNSSEVVEKVLDTIVEDSNENFFDTLDAQVNGAIQDDTPQEQPKEAPEQVTPAMDASPREVPAENQTNWDDDGNPYKVRYGDSTREAQKLKAENDKFKPWESLVGVLEKDAELVDVIRNYLDKGTKPNVKDSLELGDDFVFDMDEAISDGDSKSAHVLNTYVKNISKKESNNLLAAERQKQQAVAKNMALQNQTKQFVDKNQMTNDQFGELSNWAKTHKLSWDDIYYLKNRDKVNANIANNSKKEVLNQMNSTKSMPTTASSAGGETPGEGSHENAIFDLIQKADNNLDNIFGE